MFIKSCFHHKNHPFSDNTCLLFCSKIPLYCVNTQVNNQASNSEIICSHMCKQLNRRTQTQYNRVQRSEKPLHLCSMWLQITVLKIKAPPEGIVCLIDDTFQCLFFSQRLKDTSKADQAAAVLCYNGTLQSIFNYLITIVIIIFYMPSATMCSLYIIPALSRVYMHVRMQKLWL